MIRNEAVLPSLNNETYLNYCSNFDPIRFLKKKKKKNEAWTVHLYQMLLQSPALLLSE